MKKSALVALAGIAAVSVALTGCGRTDPGTEGGDDAAGFAADASIGVALPDQTSENWVLAGDLFENGLEEAGFDGNVQYAGSSNAVGDQQQQIQTMIDSGVEVIVIGAADTNQLAAQLEAADAAGVTVIAYDRLIQNSDLVDYYVAFDNFHVGELQAQSLLEGLEERFPGQEPWNVELFSGSADDSNSAVFFDGAMSVLQPAIDDGTINIVSGQTSVQQTATEDWAAENAQNRMDTILQTSYQGIQLHGVLSPNDNLARAILTSADNAGLETPVVTGQDSEVASVESIVAGVQYSTIYKDTRALVAATIDMVSQLQAGEEVTTTGESDNGVTEVPSNLLEPVIVTQANAAEAYAENPDLEPLTQP
ncbi:substrate-binding domain-containing protein [Agrococcus jejuensis]|uniref:Monosaccharide ABC transporter substrate-binding protein, CUT2 family n=1 Tax=Agrococcus jejuensis TaxID=399736 RepID=A0A1G8F415_9MICO|nr:sugar-binding protein [Agrococcus jejuensis]SDH76862.1 monosaccharide ABC transporter substrate-binding protein, CUT2 family [Agrococcus jejuensis]